jgi:hypothetical protein
VIFEDPDELGYFTEHARKPIWARALSTLAVCNAILPEHEQAEIMQAALCCHEGQSFTAERCRRFAGYDRLGFRADADG